jgi:hypothetical protein
LLSKARAFAEKQELCWAKQELAEQSSIKFY